MTPTLARMVLSLGGKILLPVKYAAEFLRNYSETPRPLCGRWFSVPQCWRWETVQRGRKREHYQWNMDIIGEPSVAAEVEVRARPRPARPAAPSSSSTILLSPVSPYPAPRRSCS